MRFKLNDKVKSTRHPTMIGIITKINYIEIFDKKYQICTVESKDGVEQINAMYLVKNG